METTVAVATEKGLDHQLYEDRYRLLGGDVPLVVAAGRGQIFAVMDGVGAVPRAMQAAQAVADRLIDFFKRSDLPMTGETIRGLLHEVNDEVHGWGMIPGTDRPLGAAAATVSWLSPSHQLEIFHVGDTMAFALDGPNLRRLTLEHGVGRAINRFVGQGPRFRVDHQRFDLEEGCTLCLVSDGITKAMADDHIAAALTEARTPAEAARGLLQRARGRGSRDDITVVVVDLEEW